MKLFVLAVLLAIVQAAPRMHGKAANHTTDAASDSNSRTKTHKTVPEQPPAVIYPDESPKTKQSHQYVGAEDAQQSVRIRELPSVSVSKDWADWSVWLFSLTLVGVGIAQAWLLYRTWGQIQRQADTMERQSTVLEQSVKVAQENVDLIILKERAKLTIDLKPLSLSPDVMNVYTVDFTVSIHGATAAYITETGCTAYILPLANINQSNMGDVVMFPLSHLPQVIPPNNPLIEEYAVWQWGNEGVDVLISEIRKGRILIGVRGFIRYRDVFDRSRETNFRYVWKYSRMYELGEVGNWEKCGTPEENKQT